MRAGGVWRERRRAVLSARARGCGVRVGAEACGEQSAAAARLHPAPSFSGPRGSVPVQVLPVRGRYIEKCVSVQEKSLTKASSAFSSVVTITAQSRQSTEPSDRILRGDVSSQCPVTSPVRRSDIRVPCARCAPPWAWASVRRATSLARATLRTVQCTSPSADGMRWYFRSESSARSVAAALPMALPRPALALCLIRRRT